MNLARTAFTRSGRVLPGPQVGCAGNGSIPNLYVASCPTPIAVLVKVARALSGRRACAVMSPAAAAVLYWSK